MCQVIALFILVLQLYNDKRLYDNVAAPPIILSFLWAIVHFFNLALGWATSELEYLILVIPPLFFSIGFFLSQKVFINQKRNVIARSKSNAANSVLVNNERKIDYPILLLILLLNVLLFLWQLSNYWGEVLSRPSNIWRNIYDFNAEMSSSNLLLTYSAPACYILSGFCAVLFAYKKTRKLRFLYFFSLFVALGRAFLAGNRTSIFMVIVINVFSIIIYINTASSITKRKISKKTKKLIIIGGGISLVMFIIIASLKYVPDFRAYTLTDFIISNITGYLNLSSIAFVEWYQRGFEYLYGENTFRFFNAILSRFGLNITKNINMHYDFIEFDGYITNVFTVAKTYVEDFGVLYMAIILMIFGYIHGFYYKQSIQAVGVQKITSILFCATLYIGVMFQVMGEQYTTILSMYISFYLWSYIFPRLVFRRKPYNWGN